MYSFLICTEYPQNMSLLLNIVPRHDEVGPPRLFLGVVTGGVEKNKR
jgi:hypothetical protein